MLTYINPEELTLTYRLQAGQQSLFRLIKFLGKKNRTQLKMKLQLWTQCIQSTYLYGLFAAGVTQAGYARLFRRWILDLRRITDCWAHRTHVSNSDLLASLKLDHPVDALQVRWQQHVDRQQQIRAGLPFNGVTLRFDLESHWQEIYFNLGQWYHESMVPTKVEGPDSEKPWTCPYCPRTYAHRGHMRQHISQKHSEEDPVYIYNPHRDPVNGLSFQIRAGHGSEERHVSSNVPSRFYF